MDRDFFAITTTGNVAVALDNSLDKNEALKRLEHSDSTAVFCSKDHYENLKLLLKDSDISVYKMNKLSNLRADYQKSNQDHIINPDQPAAIFYTSGTSGDSKGVILTHKNIASNINANREKYIAQGSTLSVLPYYHAYGLVVAILSVFNEEHTVFINSSLKLILEDFKVATPVVMAVVPLYLKYFRKRILDEIKKKKRNANLLSA